MVLVRMALDAQDSRWKHPLLTLLPSQVALEELREVLENVGPGEVTETVVLEAVLETEDLEAVLETVGLEEALEGEEVLGAEGDVRFVVELYPLYSNFHFVLASRIRHSI